MKKKEIKKEILRYNKKEFSSKTKKYCLCIPTINERENIEKELKRAKKYNVSDLVDIIIIDSGSTDGTSDEKFLKELNVNTIIETEVKRKYTQSMAIRTAFQWAIEKGYEGIITIDGNNKDSIEDIYKFVEKLEEGYDFIQGSRFLKGGEYKNTPLVRKIAVKLIHIPLTNLASKYKFTETTSLYRGYSKKYLIDKRVNPFRNVFESYELLSYLSTRASQIGLKTCEVPVKRNYPKAKYTTKVSVLKGNYKVFKPLIENLFGKYNV